MFMKSPFKKTKRFITIVLIVIIAIAAYFIHDGYELYRKVIDEKSIEQKVSDIRKDENYVGIDEISQNLKDSIVSIEDRRFYEHFGIDLYSIGRAVVGNFKKQELASGGSTITQQLAKNMYFSQEKKITRKIAEIFVALDLEEEYEKDEILELYLNIIYFGDGYYGIKEATNGYLNKEPSELTLYEATLLAGIPNAPSVYALSNNTKLTYERQKIVLRALLDTEKITKDEYNELLKEIEDMENK